jgi:YD repeat-containing protein
LADFYPGSVRASVSSHFLNSRFCFASYGYDHIGQLLTVAGKEAGGTPSRLQEQLGYGYDAAHNLNWRTNNALVQSFSVNSLNELASVARTGTLTVAGTTTIPAASVTVNSLPASHYADATFALGGFTPANGNNTYTAIGTDGAGNSATNTLTVNLPLTNSYSYDGNGNMISDGQHGYDYDDENELIRVTATNAWKSEFTYDGEFRRRVRKDFAWLSRAWTETNEVRYVYDGMTVLQERNSSNQPLVTYTRGVDLSGTSQAAGGIGGLLARTDANGSALYHADGNGNITALVNTSGTFRQLIHRCLPDDFGVCGKMRTKRFQWSPCSFK